MDYFVFLCIDPAVMIALLETLLDSLTTFEPSSFEMSGALEHTVDTIRSFAKEMYTSKHNGVQSQCLSILMVIGLLCGSIQMIVEAVQFMMKQKVGLHPKVLLMLKKVAAMDPDFNIAFPNNKVSIWVFFIIGNIL